MKINRNNYEAFFLDFHEGKLSEAERREVRAFVELNPDLREEFESFEIISIDQSHNLKFPGKENLKKNTVTVGNYKTWLVAFVEGDLNSGERNEVEKFLSENSVYQHELEILRRTKVLPDYTIRYSGKSSLKKGGVVIPMWVRVAAAACVIFGLLAYFFLQRKPASEFAHKELPQNKVSAPVIEPAKNPVAEIKSDVPVKDQEKKINNRKPMQEKSPEMKIEQHIAKIDSAIVPPSGKVISEQPLAEHSDVHPATNQKQETTIVINEGKIDSSKTEKMVVLDDNDLAELGLKDKPEHVPNSVLADAVNGVGKLFNVNAHYNKSELNSRQTETLALGPVKIERTVKR